MMQQVNHFAPFWPINVVNVPFSAFIVIVTIVVFAATISRF